MKNKMTVKEKDSLGFAILGILVIILAFADVMMKVNLIPTDSTILDILYIVMFLATVGMVTTGVMLMKHDRKN